MKYNFPVIFWSNNSTRVQFEVLTEIPKNAEITTCMVFVKDKGSVLLSRPERGWGLPGGHKEANESPEECAAREVLEETGVKIKNPRLIGGWKAQKVKFTEANSKYPEVAYQLLFLADVEQILPFVPEHESLERKFVAYDEIKDHHHNYEPFAEILAYIEDYMTRKDD